MYIEHSSYHESYSLRAYFNLFIHLLHIYQKLAMGQV